MRSVHDYFSGMHYRYEVLNNNSEIGTGQAVGHREPTWLSTRTRGADYLETPLRSSPLINEFYFDPLSQSGPVIGSI